MKKRKWVIFAGVFAGLPFAGCATAPVETGATLVIAPAPSRAPTADDMSEGRRNAEIAEKNSSATAEYHFSMAQAYSAEGESDRAIEEYKLTLMFDSSSALIHTRLASEYVKKGLFSYAMDECREALKLNPKFVEARLMLAGLYSTARENVSALNEYSTLLKQDPANEEAAVFKSQVLMDEDRGREAVEFLAGFVKRNKNSPIAWFYLGRAYQQMDQFEPAVKAYRQAMEIQPGFTQAGLALGYLYESKNQNDRALKAYMDVYEDSQDLAAANRISTIYLKQEKYKEALPYLQASDSADPNALNTRVKLGLVHMELKEYAKAEEVFKSILSKNPDSDRVNYYLGSIYEETSRPELAIDSLKNIGPTSNLFEDAALHVAFLLKTMGRTQDSKQYIRKALDQSPKIAGFYIFSASLEEEDKNFTGATEILESGVAQFPEHEKMRYYLGSLYDRMGHTDKSLGQMEAILTQNPDNPDALNYIGYTWTVQGVNMDDAERMLKRAVALSPKNGYILDSWGWHLFVRGRVNEAVVQLEKAASYSPNEATIVEHLADAYLRANLREKALVRYEEAQRMANQDEMRRSLQGKIDSLRGQSNTRLPASNPR